MIKGSGYLCGCQSCNFSKVSLFSFCFSNQGKFDAQSDDPPGLPLLIR